MLLLLITSAELYACEMLAIDQCETFGTSKDNGNTERGDDCICCCIHIMVQQPAVLVPTSRLVELVEFHAPAPPNALPVLVYHPPKA